MNKTSAKPSDLIERDAAYWAEDAKIEFAAAVEQAMTAHGESRKALAERLAVTPAQVTRLLRGDANLTLESMARTAHALKMRLFIHLAPETRQSAGQSLSMLRPPRKSA